MARQRHTPTGFEHLDSPPEHLLVPSPDRSDDLPEPLLEASPPIVDPNMPEPIEVPDGETRGMLTTVIHNPETNGNTMLLRRNGVVTQYIIPEDAVVTFQDSVAKLHDLRIDNLVVLEGGPVVRVRAR